MNTPSTPQTAEQEAYSNLGHEAKKALIKAYRYSDNDLRNKLKKPTADFQAWFWPAYRGLISANASAGASIQTQAAA